MNVIIYTVPDCGFCKVLKLKMDAKQISYQEINDIELLIEKGFTQAPVLEIDGTMKNYKQAMEWVKTQ